MRSDFTKAQERAIKSGQYSFHFFFELEYSRILNPDIIFRERICTAPDDTEYYNRETNTTTTFSSMGEILDIDIIPESSELRAQRVSITLSYHNQDIIEITEQYNLKGAKGTLWMGVLDKRDKIIDNLLLHSVMTIDTIDFETIDAGEAVTLSGISGFYNLTSSTKFKCSPEDQNENVRYLKEKGIVPDFFPDTDTGFDTIKALTNKRETTNWAFGPEDSGAVLDIQPSVMNGGKVNTNRSD